MIAPDRDSERLVSIAEVCDRLNLGRTAVNELVLRGTIASCKVGGRRLVSSSSVDTFIANALAANAAALER